LIEAIIAIPVLTIGLVAVAAMIARGVRMTDVSKYSTVAGTLATEKLEDLDRWPSTDSHVAPGGSLTSDVDGYFDDVSVTANGGAFTEVESAANGSYTSTTFNPSNNPVPLAVSSNSPPTVPVTFDRRWLIELSPTINGVALTGVRRVTVLVTAEGAIPRPITFQMSTVRP
jgi:hypothetical protein